MNLVSNQQPYLPPCVLKEELASMFFQVSLEWMWANILTEELLDDWGVDYADAKRRHRFSFHLTRKIYLHFQITDLRRSYSDVINEEIARTRLSKAS